jgi:tetratricopeptide (TPR) repeat protein
VLAGKLLVSDMVFQTGWPRWQYVSDVAELFPAPPAKAPALQQDEEVEDEDEFDDAEDDDEETDADEGDDDEGPDEEIDVEPYLDRAQQFRDRGDFTKALAEYEALIELLPDEPDGYHGLAWLWSTCPDAKFRNAAGAVAYAKRALGLEAEADEDEDSPLRIATLQKTLAAAQAEAGDFSAALATIELALPKAPAEERARLTTLRDLFRTKKPFREVPPAVTPAR